MAQFMFTFNQIEIFSNEFESDQRTFPMFNVQCQQNAYNIMK